MTMTRNYYSGVARVVGVWIGISVSMALGATPDDPAEKSIRELRELIDTKYSYRDFRGVDWDRAFADHDGALRRAVKPEDFAAEAARLLSVAKDPHVNVQASGRQFSSYRREVSPNFTYNTIARVVPNFRPLNSSVATGYFPEGIAYLLVKTWSRQRDADFEAIYPELAKWERVKGLIIDVRGNGGGTDRNSSALARCFLPQPVVYAKYLTRNASAPGGFNPPRDAALQPNAQGPKYHGPIAVLMGPCCMSSCENFLLMMKQVPNCVLVGEKSYGASGNPQPYALSNGVTVYLSSWKGLLLDGTCFEGQGIAPDIQVRARPADFERQDPVIDAALRTLRKGAVGPASTRGRRGRI
jgi:hypothetical protein